tara:strand:- start:936 stop:1781 length:846 start_codon:yes stop_codon:yes gene_type:complete
VVIVIGKSGQLARELLDEKPNDINAIFLGRNEINFADSKESICKIESYNPKILINASAYTNVDKAESNIQDAFFLNRDVPDILSSYCNKHKIRFIHISTDYIFDGNKTSGYEIDDDPNPINIYGKSKLAGEEAISSNMTEDFSIIRTSWLYSTYGQNFVKTILSLIGKKKEIRVVDDQFGSPTYAKFLAKFIWSLSLKTSINPIYHWSDMGKTSWYQFANKINEISSDQDSKKRNSKIKPISSDEYKFVAQRPRCSQLLQSQDSSNYWQENLRLMIENLNK